jgi:hypothetical protein
MILKIDPKQTTMKKIYTLFYISLLCFLSLAVQSQSAPVTTAAEVNTAVPGNITVPVTVNGFVSIGSLCLTLEYEPLVLTYLSCIPNPAFISNFTVTASPGTGGKYKITISWSGPALTLNGGSSATLVNLTFSYANSNGLGFSTLNWKDSGTSCEYKNGSGTPLLDSPTANFYYNGVVAGQLSPITHLPEITDAFTGVLWIPVTVNDFDNIEGISLTFEYDPGLLTYANEIISPVSGLFAGSQTLPNGNRKIVIGYFGSAVSLSDGDTLVNIKFDYTAGILSPLTWLDDGESCEYSDINFNPIYDLPQLDYYHNGFVEPALAPVIRADTLAGSVGGLVTLPVFVRGFSDINSFSLTLDYNPDVLSFDCATPNMAVAESYIASETDPGRIEIGWFGPEITLADESILMYLTFVYYGGSSSLTWNDEGATCEYTSGELYLPLFDLPTQDFYKNGLVTPSPAWTGAVSTDWNIGANWLNNYPPDRFFDAVINSTPAPSHWPQFSGDFAVGAQCKSLTINGDAIMNVSGNMTIEPGHLLKMTGAGQLKIGGDWNNYGTFEPGTGTVDFTGVTDGDILQGTFPNTSLSAYALSTFTKGMTAISGGTAGPTGDNAHADVNIGFTFSYLGVNYTSLRINTNGWISFNLTGSDATSANNNNLFFTDAPGAVLAPWWDDLKADGSTAITYKSTQTIFTIEWKNLLAFSSGSTTRLNFQVKLYRSTNEIEFCYGSVTSGTHNAAEGASIGIKDATGGIGRFIEATTNSGNTATTCLISNIDWPLVNYRFALPQSRGGAAIFWKVAISKTNAKLNIMKDVSVMGH